MRTEILFKDIRRSEYIENFISDKVEILTDKLIQPDSDLHVIVRVEKERQRTDNRHPVFHCEVTIKSGVSAKPLVISKQDRNIFRAIVSSFDTLKVLLGKNHDRLRHDRRRRGGIAELNESYNPDLDAEFLGAELIPPSPIANT